MTNQDIMRNFGKSTHAMWWDVVIALVQNGQSMEDAFVKADTLIRAILEPAFKRPF